MVNAARGASISIAEEELPKRTFQTLQRTSLAIAKIFDQRFPKQIVMEMGLDFVIDSNFVPWFLEANARPRGKLQYLYELQPEKFAIEYQKAWELPFYYLAEKSSEKQ